tara:strand:+ start:695 stop:1105 length:411 start_codon:yes stop_codon:yes gene_type:complete
MTYELSTWSKYAIGYDRLFDQMLKGNHALETNYPLYDLIKRGENTYTIELALAGFKKDELKIELKHNHLTIRGETKERNIDAEYLHKGIAARSFTREFGLADTIQIEGVDFIDGILSIGLKQVIPEEQKPKVLTIN